MKQQVNLYQLRFHQTKPFLPGSLILGVCGLTLALLLLIYGYAWWRLSSETQRLAFLRERHSEGQLRISELARTHPPAETDPQLEARVRTLTATREAKTRLLRLLSTQRLGNTAGFSEPIAGLARQRVDGLWLREIRLDEGGQELALAGSALEAELVPHLIQRLREESAFVGKDFKSFRMQRSEDEGHRIDFTLSTNGKWQP